MCMTFTRVKTEGMTDTDSYLRFICSRVLWREEYFFTTDFIFLGISNIHKSEISSECIILFNTKIEDYWNVTNKS